MSRSGFKCPRCGRAYDGRECRDCGWRKPAAFNVLALVAAIALLAATACMPFVRTVTSRLMLGGEGELVTAILCPLISESGNVVAALPERGEDESLWHIVKVLADPVLGCDNGDTEELLVMPGVVPLTDKQVPKWVPGDRVALTVADAENPRAPMSRAEHRLFSVRSASTSPGLAEGAQIDQPRRVVVRANRRNSL